MDIFENNLTFILLVLLLLLCCIFLNLSNKNKDIKENFVEQEEYCPLDIDSSDGQDDLDVVRTFTKKSKVDEANKCNNLQPYSEYMIRDPSQNLTRDEVKSKETQWTNKPSNYSPGRCCDPKDPVLLQKLKNLILPSAKFGDYQKNFPYVKKKKNKNGKEIYKICRRDPRKCIEEGFSPLTPYDLCKIVKDNDVKNLSDTYKCTIKDLYGDCYEAPCPIQTPNGFSEKPIMDKNNIIYGNVKFSYFEDLKLINAIKKDDVEYLGKRFKIYNKDRQLLHGYPGNTLLHEAIYHDAKECINFLIKSNVKTDIQNKDGNTALQLACLKGHFKLVDNIIKLGGGGITTEKNGNGDTLLHSAVRSGSMPMVVYIIDKTSGPTPLINEVNHHLETPLEVSILTPKKNMKIIRYLVDQGTAIEKVIQGGDNGTVLKNLQKQEKSVVNEEARTLVHQLVYKYYNDRNEMGKYNKLLKDKPEFRPYVIDIPEADEKESDINNVEVIYDSTVRPNELYINSYRKPLKTLSPETKNFLDEYKL